MKVTATIPTQQLTVQGNVNSTYIRAQVFATDADGAPTGLPLSQHDGASPVPPNDLTIPINNTTFPSSGLYALVQFSLDSNGAEVTGTHQVTTFHVSVITAPAPGATVTLS